MIAKNTIAILIMLIPFTAAAQNGLLKGKVIDAELGEELIGATIVVEGSSIGVTSDLDGNYAISDLKPGVYTFVSQFISYQTQKFENVEIKPDKTTTLNIALKPESLGLDEVVIVAKASKRSEAALLNVQKKSTNVIEGLSAEQMSRSGDGDAASALKRVTGINVAEGKYIFVRGLSDRYSKTTLNGSEIPGLDPNRNTVQMDIFPSSLIENIVVYKSFSPDLPGDFTGGYINIETRDFPETFCLDAAFSFGFNTQASFNNNYLSYQGSTSDALGFDNGFRSIPQSASASIPDYPVETQTLTSITTDFNKIMEPQRTTSFLNNKVSFSVGDNKNIGKQSQLGYIFGFSYKHDDEFYENGEKGRYQLNGQGDSQLNTQHKYTDTRGRSEALWGTLLNVSLKINQRHKLGINLFKNQSGMSSARYMQGKKPSDDADGLLIETRVLQWLERSLNTAQLRGEHYFENMLRLKFNWLAAVSYSYQDEPDMRFFTNSYYPGNNDKNKYQIEPSIYKVPARYYRFMEEMNYDFKANFTLDLGSGKHTPTLKFGASYLHKNRSFNDKRIDYAFQMPSNSYNGSISDFIADESIGNNIETTPANGRLFGLYVRGNPADDLKNSYNATQNVSAAYLMLDTKIGSKFRLTGGLRLEHTLINSQSLDTRLEHGYLNNTDFLPALNLTYHLNNSTNLRLNLSRTLARPTFRELAPYANEDFAGGETYIGNAQLQRTLINNVDIKWEYFMRTGEIVSLAVFYKGFTNPIELVDNPKAQNPELKWENTDKATVYGFETDLRKKFDFINALRNIKLGINFSYIVSSVDIDTAQHDGIRTEETENVRSRAMWGQSPYIVNVFASYENSKHGVSANLVYNVSGPKIVVNVKGATPDIYEQPLHSLNFVANKSIGKNFILNFKVKNILNSTFRQSYSYNNKEYNYRSFKRGVLVEFGIKYSIK